MKLRNKLILSCAALAAVATTAFSTTFAWYTANDTVKANGITGKTSTQDATLLLISKTGISGQWGASVDINSAAVTMDPVTYMKADKYVKAKDVTSDNFADKKATLYTASTGATPTYTSAAEGTFNAETTYYYKKDQGKYYQWDSANNQEGAEATGGLANTNQYISFYLYFKSGSAQSLSVTIDKFNLRNTTYAAETTTLQLPTQTVLAAGTGASGSTYTVDMLKATNIVVTQAAGTETAAEGTVSPVIAAGAGTRNAYACDDVAAAGTIGSGANAHTYYNNVKSLTGTDDALDTTIETSEASLGTVNTLNGTAGTPATKYTFTVPTGAGATGAQDAILMVKFDIYLDGWDKLCFDACRKQTFALDMEFTGKPYVAPAPTQG